MLYKRKVKPVRAVELQWENWGEVCEIAGVGRLLDGKPEGCYLDEDGEPTPRITGRLGLMVPGEFGLEIMVQGDMLVKFPNLRGKEALRGWNREEFFLRYEPVSTIIATPFGPQPINAFFG